METPASFHRLAPMRALRARITWAWWVCALACGPAYADDGGRCRGGKSTVKVLTCDRHALQARLDLIAQSERSIDVATYSLNPDEIGLTLLDQLRQAARRGVRVRVLVDGIKWHLGNDGHRYLQAQGIEFALFHPPQLRGPQWLNQRLHSKLMVCDGEVAVIGSRNLENGHFGLDKERNYADCDAVVAGPIAGASQCYFDQLWESDEVRPAPLRDALGHHLAHCLLVADAGKLEREWHAADSDRDYERLLRRAAAHVENCLQLNQATANVWLAGAVSEADLQLLRDCRFDKSARRFQQSVIELIDHAAHGIVIETPYPAFDRPTRTALRRARQRGVRVMIITNSLENNDVLVTYAAYQNQKRGLLAEGVQLREYCGPRTLHAKTMLVDDATWMLGSYNFDARSNRANLELGIVSDCPLGAQQLRASVRHRIKHTVSIAPRSVILSVGGETTAVRRGALIFHRVVVEAYRCLL